MKIARRLRTTLIAGSDAGVFRMGWFALFAIVSTIALMLTPDAAFRSPNQLLTILSATNKLAWAAWAGYWVHRMLFRRRTHTLTSVERRADELNKAMIVAAALVAMAIVL